MFIRSLTAHAFGPLVGETLEFADGMTVVHGPNESAKSSWHAAIYAALCGRRRGAGSHTDDRDFVRRHRPWDRDDWLVSARLLLDDGRLVELRQDLDGKVDCDAVDLELGRDCSAEITNGGTPDAARWLGLDRSSFRATACVGQAQVLDVLGRADGLQAHLQRAASTATADQTAVAARRRIDDFRAEVVGSERAPTRPLRRAMAARDAAVERLARARADHAEYERRLVELEELRRVAQRADQALHRAEAAVARHDAHHARQVLDEATALAARLAQAAPPPASAATADLVAAALASATTVAGPVEGPAGEEHVPPPEPQEELYVLARALEAVPAPLDPGLVAQAEAARSEVAAARRRRGRAAVLAWSGAAVLAVGLATAVVGSAQLAGAARMRALVVAAVAGLVGVVLLLAGGPAARRAGAGLAAAQARLAGAELGLAAAGAQIAAVQARYEEALVRVGAAGLEADPAALRERARDAIERRAVHLRDQRWHQDTSQRLRAAAGAIGAVVATAEQAEAALRDWQRRQVAAAAARERYASDEAALGALLRGQTLPELRARAEALQRRAAAMAPSTGDEPGDSIVDDDELGRLREAAVAASGAAHAADLALSQWLVGVTAVGEAEEELARADEELHRLRDLDATLEITREFLARAEQTAHRTIAPRLAEAVRGWLPETTAGRYTDVTVDPERLEVRVRGAAGRWRDAGRLSQGTAEQIYLMLRVALADQLVKPGVRCPLLLDDVTVHADPTRTRRLLDLLCRVSDDHQVILFTQEQAVVDWARQNLSGPRHAVVELTGLAPV